MGPTMGLYWAYRTILPVISLKYQAHIQPKHCSWRVLVGWTFKDSHHLTPNCVGGYFIDSSANGGERLQQLAFSSRYQLSRSDPFLTIYAIEIYTAECGTTRVGVAAKTAPGKGAENPRAKKAGRGGEAWLQEKRKEDSAVARDNKKRDLGSLEEKYDKLRKEYNALSAHKLGEAPK